MLTEPKVTIELSFPVKVDGIETSVLQMRRPKVKDQLVFEKRAQGMSDAEREIRLFANLCEVAPEDIEALDLMDYAKLGKQYEDFLKPEPELSEEETSGE